MHEQVVAEVVRSGFVEGRHHGVVVRTDPTGEVAWAAGDPYAPIFPRSCNKPVQAAAMVRAGLPLRGRRLALASASHSGETFHLDAVREVLASAGLDESDLQMPPEYPFDEQVRDAYLRSGAGPERILMACSGKHAAMLATCVANDWDTATYLEPSHPLQQLIAETFAEITGEPIASVGVDGCGAPVFATSPAALARGFGRIAAAGADSAEGLVAAAICGWPEYVSGTARDEVRLIRAFPGAIAKSGAEACYAVGMPDGTGFALKIGDGGARARAVVMAEALRLAGCDDPVLDETGRCPLLGGGRPVGEVRPTLR